MIKFPDGYGVAHKHVRWGKGEQNANARLTWDIVRKIRAEAASGERICNIAWYMGVNRGTVYKIIHNQQWIE